MKACALVPIYDHGSTLARVLDGLASSGLPILLVDDCEAALRRAVDAGATQLSEISAPVPGSAFVYVLSPGGQAVGFVQGNEPEYRATMGMQPLGSYWS